MFPARATILKAPRPTSGGPQRASSEVATTNHFSLLTSHFLPAITASDAALGVPSGVGRVEAWESVAELKSRWPLRWAWQWLVQSLSQ